MGALHRETLEGLSARAEKWWRAETPVAEPDFGEELEAQVDISAALTFGRGYLAYVYRSAQYIRDTAEFDDRFIIELDEPETEEILNGLLAVLVEAFHPYRAAIEFDEDLVLDDWDASVARGRITGRDEDGRDGVWRISPRSYFDTRLCEAAFGLSADEVVSRLKQSGIRAVKMAGGVLVDDHAGHSNRAELIDFDERARSAIGVSRPGVEPPARDRGRPDPC